MYSINVNGVWRASPKDDYSDGSALASLLGGVSIQTQTGQARLWGGADNFWPQYLDISQGGHTVRLQVDVGQARLWGGADNFWPQYINFHSVLS